MLCCFVASELLLFSHSLSTNVTFVHNITLVLPIHHKLYNIKKIRLGYWFKNVVFISDHRLHPLISYFSGWGNIGWRCDVCNVKLVKLFSLHRRRQQCCGWNCYWWIVRNKNLHLLIIIITVVRIKSLSRLEKLYVKLANITFDIQVYLNSFYRFCRHEGLII